MRKPLNLPPIDPACRATVHRTWAAHNAGCRCADIVQRVQASRRRWKRRNGDVVPPLRGPLHGEPDEALVLRVVGGEREPLPTLERRAAIDRLDRSGLSALEIARRVGCSERTVQRRRAQRREQVAA